jgi:hypothetical protein
MELAWKGQGISVRILIKQVEATPAPAAKRVHRPPSPEQRREIEKQYLLASATRYIAPTR